MAFGRRRNTRIRFQSLVGFLAGGLAGYLYTNHRHSRALQRRFLMSLAATPSSAPRPGDLLLFHNAQGTSNITGWLTGSPFYHVGLYAGNGRVVEARPRGVVDDSLRDRLHDFVVVPAPAGKGAAALAWAKSKVGDPYDNLDVGIIVLEHIFTHLHLNYTPSDRFTCAEFVARAFAQAGVDLFPGKDIADVVPADYARFLPAVEIPAH